MKKILLGFTTLALILTGCQKSEIVETVNDGDNELTFGVYQGKATRAAELTNDALQSASATNPIKLYAYHGETDNSGVKTLYFEEGLKYDALKWKTGIKRFLPQTGTLQFYAYYPDDAKTEYDGSTALAADGFPTLIHDIAAPEDQVDLVAAKVNNSAGNKIAIPLKHILSQVNFGVKGYEGARIEISEIKINNVYNRGQFDFEAWAWTALDADKDDKNPINTNYDYLFAGGSTAAASQYITPGTPNDGGNTYIFGDGGKGGPGKDATTKYVTGSGSSAVIDGNSYNGELENSLMLMPQEFTVNTAANVTFKYRICDMGTPDAGWIVGSVSTWVDGKFDLNFAKNDAQGESYAGAWDPNFRYIYLIDFTSFLDGQALTFEVDVEKNPWENYNGEGDNDGIIYVSSTGQPTLEALRNLAVDGTLKMPYGHVFTNVAWDWSLYTMTKNYATANNFKIEFDSVNFGGQTITITAPFGFTVRDNVTSTAEASVTVDAKTTVLTFTPTADYYAITAGLNAAIAAAAADGKHAFNVSNDIDLKNVVVSNITTGSVELTFAAAYSIRPLPKGWTLDAVNKVATYATPAP